MRPATLPGPLPEDPTVRNAPAAASAFVARCGRPIPSCGRRQRMGEKDVGRRMRLRMDWTKAEVR
jgi:hypothetical protein